jgi:hypothetical protein
MDRVVIFASTSGNSIATSLYKDQRHMLKPIPPSTSLARENDTRTSPPVQQQWRWLSRWYSNISSSLYSLP